MQASRKTMKILHTVGAAGLAGGLLVHFVLLIDAQSKAAETYVSLRLAILDISDYVIFPSMAICLLAGLLGMMVHRPFQEKGWVWLKAALGILVVKGIITIVSAKAVSGLNLANEIVAGTAGTAALSEPLFYERWTIIIMLLLALANIVLGVWRPRVFGRREARVGNTQHSSSVTQNPAE